MSDSIKSRIQLKNDTEENWNKAINFVPKKGELIIYNAESGENINDKARLFPRLKVGDGITNVINLPFIDAGTINGEKLENFIPTKLAHSLTFGTKQNYVFDGSQDVTVPTYTGDYNTI